MRLLMSVALVVLVAGCASPPTVPADYSGPLATVFDSGEAEDRSKAQMFVLAEIDGNRVDNSIVASRRASSGQGFALTTAYLQRSVPARPMKVKLLGTHTTAAPIHEMASRMAGTFFSVEGVVDFSPKPDGRYVVKGELKKTGSAVWIEDSVTNQPVTERVRSN
jgi:hypothetical protein